jgi:SAM-dependent methyltransferase
LAHVLDPRPAAEAARELIADSVNIPVNELHARTHELPPRTDEVPVADVAPQSQAAVAWLQAHGRRARLETAVVRVATESPQPQGRLWRPNGFLESIISQIEPGVALDLACGSGRDVVFLAACGWRVVGIDLLPDALSRAARLAGRYTLRTAPIWRCVDLESESLALDGQYDLITCFRYLHRPLLSRIAALLRRGGHWVVETFTTEHRRRHGKPGREAFVLRAGELAELTPGLRVRHFSEDWRGEAHTARLWGQKPADQ